MEKPLNIDYERMTATVSLAEGPFILMVNEGKARLVKVNDYGEFTVKIHEGKFGHFYNTESGKF